MKKLKLFVMAMVAMVVAAVGVSAAGTKVCDAADETAFKACVEDDFTRVIHVNGSYELTDDYTINNKRIVIDGNTLTVVAGKTLKLENFKVMDDDDTYFANNGGQINVLFVDNNSKLIIKGNLVAENVSEATAGQAIALGSKTLCPSDGFCGTFEVDGGTASISGYGHSALRTYGVSLKSNAELEVFNCGHGGNVLDVTIADNSVYNTHDNDRGLTTRTLTASDDAQLSVTDNKLSGLYAAGTIGDNATVISNNNGQEDVGITGNGLQLSGNATLNAGNVLAPYGGSNAKLTVNTGAGDNVNLNVEHFAHGTFTAPTSGLTGVVHVDNKYYVYTLDDDKTVEVGTDTGDGTILVVNYTGKEIGVTTPDSTHVVKVASGDHNHVIYFVTLTVDGKDDKVSLFKGQTFGELSKAGKAKLDEMLKVEGQHINNYFDASDVKLDDSHEFAVNTVIHASHYVVLTIGNYEFWVNPGTSLSDLTGEDLEKLEAIKTDSNRKFMYFAVNGKAISEEDTKFNVDTTILVFYEGNDVPVVPDTPVNPDQPTKPVEEKADTTELEKAIAEAEKYLDDKKYDAKEVEALKNLIEEAKGLLESTNQTKVDEMVKVLADATTKVANTGDNIMSVVATSIASLALIAGGFVLVRKNKFN